MANSTAPATNNDQSAEDPNKKKDQVAAGTDEAAEDKEDDKEPDAISTAASDAWTDVSSFISWGASKATDAAKGLASLVVPDIWGSTTAQPEATQPVEKKPEPEKKPAAENMFVSAFNWVKGGVEKVAGAVSDAWKSVFGSDAKVVEDKNPDGSKKGFTVTQSDGDVITATRDNTVIKRPDGTTVTRDNGATTVEKNGVSITRTRDGKETFRLADGTTGEVNDKTLTAELKGLHETVNDRGVHGDLITARGAKISYFKGGHRRMSDLTPDEKNNDIVEAANATRIALDKDAGIFAQKSTNPQEKSQIISRNGSNEGIEVKQVDGKVVARLVRLDAEGNAIAGSHREARELPQWFKDYTAKRNNGVTPQTTQEALQVAGVAKAGKDELTVTAATEIRLGVCESEKDRAAGRTVCVEVPTGDNPEQKVIFANGGGVQKTTDVANNQSTEYDGTNYEAKNGDQTAIKFNVHDRHLELFDERGNKIADSTAQGTRFADGDYVGSDGSYTDGTTGRRYFSQQAQEMQAAQNQSIVALNTATGQINSFKASLGRPGTVDIGELSGSMGSLTQALALCIKSGNFTHLASILSTMGAVQDLIAQGVKHNADVATVKAAVHDARDTELDATRNAPNDVAVETLRRNRMSA